MYVRPPFEISVYLTTENMAAVLGISVKGVKIRATREKWVRTAAPDGTVLWTLSGLPVQVRHIVHAILLEQDAQRHDFIRLMAEEYAVAVRSFPLLRDSGATDCWFDAAVWCRRLEMVDDILTCVPGHKIPWACVSVAHATGIPWRSGIEQLIEFTTPLTDKETPVLELDRRYWLPVILDRLMIEEKPMVPPWREQAKIIYFSSRRNNAGVQE